MKITFIVPSDELHLWPNDKALRMPPEAPKVGDTVVVGSTCWLVQARSFVMDDPQQLKIHLVHAPEMEVLQRGGSEPPCLLH